MEKKKDSGKLISLVIHTPERAAKLKDILEAHGIEVKLENVDANLGLVPPPMMVKIPESALLTGLKILESGEVTGSPKSMMKIAGLSSHLLIPVDFSSTPMLAVKAGFAIAERFGVEPILLHAFAAPVPASPSPFAELPDSADLELVEEGNDIRSIASGQLSKLKMEIKEAQDNGEVAALKFSTTLLEGVPEEVILDYCKMNAPMMVVMTTRDSEKKKEDLVGSVTAEVMDSCRIPVLAIPDNWKAEELHDVKRVLMFCDKTRHDVMTVRALMAAYDYPECSVYMVAADESESSASKRNLEATRKYLSDMFPTGKFSLLDIEGKSFDRDIGEEIEKRHIQLVIAPNKKSNVFSRLFRPTLAHRCLFERDVPLLALPV